MAVHSRERDARAIAHHYDVSNDFHRLWLDPQMVYSCAYFRNADTELVAAQSAKLDHILTKIMLQQGERLLDIGCGWGALALRAAERYGARVVGITLSQNQFELARERVRAAGLADRVEVLLKDYRDVEGSFDKITSVGMFEHEGLANLPTYFAKIHSLRVDGGLALNHGITSTEPDCAESPYGAGDFIGEFVFPHGELPHISLVLREMQGAGLEALDVESLRRHYARTLRLWAANYEAHRAQIRPITDETTYRVWRIYLAGCAHAFSRNWVSIHQVLACKAGPEGLNPTPLTREYMYHRGCCRRQAPRKSPMACATAAGCSMNSMCGARGITLNCAPGTASAIILTMCGGDDLSSSPAMASVGMRSPGRCGSVSMAAIAFQPCAQPRASRSRR